MNIFTAMFFKEIYNESRPHFTA